MNKRIQTSTKFLLILITLCASTNAVNGVILLKGGSFNEDPPAGALNWEDTGGHIWNSIGEGNTLNTDNLLDLNGDDSGISITRRLGNWLNQGASSQSPGFSSGDNFEYADDSNGFNFAQGAYLDFSGFATDGTTYSFRFWAGYSVDRTTKYQIEGSATWEGRLYLDDTPATDTVTLSGITPDDEGNLRLGFDGSDGDTDFTVGFGDSFGYLGAVEIIAVPEPSTAVAVAGLIGLAGVFWKRRRLRKN